MKKSTALVMAVSLAACGKDTESAEATQTETVQAQTKVIEEETTTEGTEPSVEFVEPEAKYFEYKYDAALEGVIITGYRGNDQAIRIPAEIDGNPVRYVTFFGSVPLITHVELPDSVTSIGEGAFAGSDALRLRIRGRSILMQVIQIGGLVDNNITIVN